MYMFVRETFRVRGTNVNVCLRVSNTNVVTNMFETCLTCLKHVSNITFQTYVLCMFEHVLVMF